MTTCLVLSFQPNEIDNYYKTGIMKNIEHLKRSNFEIVKFFDIPAAKLCCNGTTYVQNTCLLPAKIFNGKFRKDG